MKSKSTYLKSSKEDDEMYIDNKFDSEASLKDRAARKKRKLPTSVALDSETIFKLKSVAEEKGIPYQVLMRSYILKGLKEDTA